jgi:hypothetical protein
MLRRITIGVVLLSGLCLGAGRRPGAVFLMIWPGSRPTALGGAFSAIADDASAAYYNPGGLGFQRSIVLSMMHVNWLPGLWDDMYYEYLAVAAPFKKVGTFAFNGVYLTTGETVVQNESGTVIGTYTTFDLSMGLAYGREIAPSFSVGGGLKFIYSFLVPEWVLGRLPGLGMSEGGQGFTWAVDAGVLYKPFERFHVGTTLQNLGPPISFSANSEPDPLPLMLRMGASYKPLSVLSKDTTKEQFEIVGLRLTTDITKVLIGMFAVDPPEVDSMSFGQELGYEIGESWRSLGMEVSVYREILTLRVGYFFDKSGARGGFVLEEDNSTEHVGLFPFLFGSQEGKLTKVGVTFGAGVKYAGFQLDVGVDELIYDFPTANRKFSLTYTF